MQDDGELARDRDGDLLRSAAPGGGPNALSGENRCTLVNSTLAASYRQVRVKASPHFEIRPCRSVSPD
jgi:hypothetical protein